MSNSRNRGFTLVELLVVIAIIGVLVSLLLPAVQAAREAARRMKCQNNCKQIGLAIHNYHDTFGALPLAWWLDIPPRPLNGAPWGVQILPFLEQQPLYDKYDLDWAPLDQTSPANVKVIQTPLEVYICPSNGGGGARKYTFNASPVLPVTATDLAPSDYIVTTGVRGNFARIAYGPNVGGNRDGAMQVHGPFGNNRNGQFASIADGLSKTFLIAERSGGNEIFVGREPEGALAPFVPSNGGGWGDVLNGEHWLQGSLFTGNPLASPNGGPCAINCNSLRGWSYHSFHPGGCNVVMADGTVQFVNEAAAALVVASQITRRKGEILPP